MQVNELLLFRNRAGAKSPINVHC